MRAFSEELLLELRLETRRKLGGNGVNSAINKPPDEHKNTGAWYIWGQARRFFVIEWEGVCGWAGEVSRITMATACIILDNRFTPTVGTCWRASQS